MQFIRNDMFVEYKNINKFEDEDKIYECFKFFDQDNDEVLNESEFINLLKKLYAYKNDKEFLPREKLVDFFKYYANFYNHQIGFRDFKKFWNKTVRLSLYPRSALIIIDVQNDFIDGTLALKNSPAGEDGYEVIPLINKLITEVPFNLIVYTQDWHPPNHISFYENLSLRKLNSKTRSTNICLYDVVLFEGNIEQKLWPAHCQQYSSGAALHPKLKIHDNSSKTLILKKGTSPNIDSYSAFFDNNKKNRTALNYELSKVGITDLYICGVATDYCVGATASDGLDLNYRVSLIQDACRGVNSLGIQSTKRKLIEKGALMINSNEVRGMVEGSDRRIQLGYATIVNNTNTQISKD